MLEEVENIQNIIEERVEESAEEALHSHSLLW